MCAWITDDELHPLLADAPAAGSTRPSPSLGDDVELFATDAQGMIRGLIILALLFLVFTFPATWLLMLFLGNIGLNLSYWGALPLGVLVSSLLGTAGTQWDWRD
jgi:hypothetical protein